MRSKSRQSIRYSSCEVPPGLKTPLIRPRSQTVETAGASSVSLTLCIVSAQSLRPMHKGITSNPMCEVSLLLVNDSSSLMISDEHTTCTKTFKTQIVRSSLNPIWNLDIDFGDVDMGLVVGLLLVVKHVEKMGVVRKDIGQVLLTADDLMELKTQVKREQSYPLTSTEGIEASEAQEGLTNRKYGSVTIRFNSYGLRSPHLQSTATRTSYELGYNAEDHICTSSEGDVKHEDDFLRPTKSTLPHNIQSEIRELQSYHQAKPTVGETWYAISAAWIESWLRFVTTHHGQSEYVPGEIANSSLLLDDLPNGRLQIRDDLRIKKDFRLINQQSWNMYYSLYGGGPAIEVKVPMNCADTSTWLASLQLHQVARVGSSYID